MNEQSPSYPLSSKRSASALLLASLLPLSASGAVLADVLAAYEPGANANVGFTNASNALSTSGLVSLGSWSRAAGSDSTVPVGLTLGFSTAIANGAGADFKVVGNPFTGWFEPGLVEVAMETSGLGATVDGWMDETFYLLKPSNFDMVGDPRQGPLDISYPFSGPWADQGALEGWADVTPGGDLFDLDWAIDAAGAPISLGSVAYVRIRTATNNSAGPFGSITTEVNYVEALAQPIPEPTTLGTLLTGAGVLFLALRRWRRS